MEQPDAPAPLAGAQLQGFAMTTHFFSQDEIDSDCDERGSRIPFDPELWNLCAACRGSGTRRMEGLHETGLCLECHGKGGEVTVKGRRLVAFLRKHVRLSIE